MANVLAHLSSILIPAVIFFIIGYGWIHKCNLYDDFINGAADGLKTVVGIVPTLIGLMMAVGILRGSGLLDLPGKLLQKYAADSSISGMFPEFFPLIFIRLFSSSAATGLVLDIFKTYGTDSLAGRITSILMSCTETCFYTMSVYFMTARVSKSRYTLAGALLSTAVGVVMSARLQNIRYCSPSHSQYNRMYAPQTFYCHEPHLRRSLLLCSSFLLIKWHYLRSITLQKITAANVLTSVASTAGPTTAAGLALPYWLR